MAQVQTFATGGASAVPDVTMVPPFAIPTPFPNLGMNAMAIPTYFTIMIECKPELDITATIAVTSGDETGSMGGVASGTIVGPARAVKGSIKVFLAGKPVWRTTDPTMQNLTNAVGVTSIPSQVVKTVLT